jgi:ABC-type uncharacterized transport system substrate-binding protein
LVGVHPDVILTNGTPATAAVQQATRTIPIVFANVADPVLGGIVARLDRPGGNVTGFANNEAPLAGKWLELLAEIAPGLKRAAIIFSRAPVSFFMPSFETAARSSKVALSAAPVHSDIEIETAVMALGREPGGESSRRASAETVAIASSVDTECCRVRRSRGLGVSAYPIHHRRPAGGRSHTGPELIVVNAGTDGDLETGFATFWQQRVGAVLLANSTFYSRRLEQLVALAARHALPAIFSTREFAVAGGLMSYGSSPNYAFHQAGIYTGRILKGEKPADLPVVQASKLELAVNLKTAKALGLTIPETLLATADEVIQ